MTEHYDHDTMRAIVAEAKRQGFPDELIANHLGIANNDPAFGYGGDDQLRATISEYQHRGIHREGIAERMGITLEEVLRLEGRTDLRTGFWGGCYVADPGDPHHESNILRLIERGRVKLAKNANRGIVLRTPSREETLALLVDGLGLEGTRNLIEMILRRIWNVEPTAAALHIPEIVVRAVTFGSFPTSDSASKTLQ